MIALAVLLATAAPHPAVEAERAFAAMAQTKGQWTAFRAFAARLTGRERQATHPYWSDAAPCAMHIEEVEAIWTAIAERDDWQPLQEKVAAIRRMGEAMAQNAPAAA